MEFKVFFFPFQIKEMFSLPGLLGSHTAISQTPAFISLQMGTTSSPWNMGRMQLRGSMEKAEYGWADPHWSSPLELELPAQECLTNMHGEEAIQGMQPSQPFITGAQNHQGRKSRQRAG